MKRVLIILLLILSFTASGTVWHVATTGNDGTGDGTVGTPWLTIAHAISESSSGDSIYVTAGTYAVTAQMAVGTGISIYGAGATSIISSSSAIQAIFLLESVSEGTNGAQSISNLRMTGGDEVDYGIYIIARSNVLVHDCEFYGFEQFAIQNRGGTSGGTGRPVTWATGAKIYNNTITDCGYDVLDGGTLWLVYGGGISITGQSGPEVYDNDINNGEGFGWGIRCLNDSGFIKGAAIYDNKIRVNFRDVSGQTSYAFCIELWTGKGGNHVYRNDCNGGIDFSGYGWDDTDGYGFAVDVSDNTIILPVKPTNTEEAGLLFESGCTGGVYFRRNFVKNFSKGLVFSLRQNSLVQGMDGFYVDYNVFREIGQVSGSMTGTTLEFNTVPSTGYVLPAINDFRFANNVTHRTGSVVQTYGLNCVATNAATGTGATWTNVVAANNISYNVYTPLKWEDQVVDTVTIVDNYSYNATNNNRFVDCTVTNNTVEAMATADPLFKSSTNLHLQSTSPCIDTGTDWGNTTDKSGNYLYGTTYDIGAYEWGRCKLMNDGKLSMNNGNLVIIEQ
jgi:hypothetical protein